MNCVLATTRAIAESTSGWMLWYCARRSTIGTLMAASSLPSARETDQARRRYRDAAAAPRESCSPTTVTGSRASSSPRPSSTSSTTVLRPARKRQRDAERRLAGKRQRRPPGAFRRPWPHAAMAVVAAREEDDEPRARPAGVGLQREIQRRGPACRREHDELGAALADEEARRSLARSAIPDGLTTCRIRGPGPLRIRAKPKPSGSKPTAGKGDSPATIGTTRGSSQRASICA